MFDLNLYFNTIASVLETDKGRFEVLRHSVDILPRFEEWTYIDLRIHVRFATGHELTVCESYSRRDKLEKEILRRLSYHFMDEYNGCIFRFTSHGEEWAIDAPCELRVGPDGPSQRLYQDGDPDLSGFCLSGIDFLKAFKLAFDKVHGEKLPWEGV